MLINTSKNADTGKKVFVLGIDGTPFSFLKNEMKNGVYSNFGALAEKGTFCQMNSVYPPVSSVAWSSFMTGKNPGKHNIFGFIDRRPDPLEAYVPNSLQMRSDTLWDIISSAGKRSVVINVPVTYPPKKINGVLISGFLGTNLKKSVYPMSYLPYLESIGYRIDIDPWKAREDTDYLIEDLHYTLNKRMEAAFNLWERENPDFFMVHIMETDRLHHFMWDYYEKGEGKYYDEFIRFHKRVDQYIGKIAEKLKNNTELIIMSDHGFCSLKKEIYINHFLQQNGYLKYTSMNPKTLQDVSPDSLAFSVVPVRIFINLKGREAFGCIRSGIEYENVRNEIKSALFSMKDPGTGEKIIDRIFYPEEIYSGPYIKNAPDLICFPFDGYDLKGNMDKMIFSEKSKISGMHTYFDASFYIRDEKLKSGKFSITDIAPAILEIMGIIPPSGLDSTHILAE